MVLFFSFFHFEVYYFFFYFLCQKLSVWLCSRDTPATETHLAWIISSSSSAYKPHFQLTSCLAGLNLPCCWNIFFFVCVGCGSIQSLTLLLQLLFFFFGFLIACMFANHKRRETHKEPMCNCEFTDEIPLNLNHTWTHSNHRAPLLLILNVLLASSMRNQIDIPNKCS